MIRVSIKKEREKSRSFFRGCCDGVWGITRCHSAFDRLLRVRRENYLRAVPLLLDCYGAYSKHATCRSVISGGTRRRA